MATVTNTYQTTFTSSLMGSVFRQVTSETFSTIRAGAGTATLISDGQAVTLTGSSTSNQFATMGRQIMLFDTTSIPVGATITSAIINLTGLSKANNLGSDTLEIVSSAPASTSSVTSTDYSTLGNTSFASVSYSSYVVGSNTITLNSLGLSNITKAGVSKFGIRMGWDLSGTFGGTWASLTNSSFSFSGVNTLPTLTVTYTQTFPTLSINNISSLTNVTTITTS